MADLGTALGLALYRFGVQDADRELVGRLLRAGDTFVDGGANIGLFTLAAATRVGRGGSVIAVEPATSTRALLQENLDLNGFSWVSVESSALAEQSGDRLLVVFGENAAGLSSFSPSAAPGGVEERVQTTTLDHLLGDRVPRVVKLDLEGAELSALRGATRLLTAAQSVFVVEVEDGHLRRQGASAAELLKVFDLYGYRLFKAGFLPSGEVVVAAAPFERADGSPNIVAVPKESFFEQVGIRVVDRAELSA